MRYLEAVALRLPKRLIVGGHSKGGNLALYAALRAKPAVQERIERVYTHDGPGFKAGTVDAAEYAAIRDRVHKTVPQDSLVGMLMDAPANLDLHVVHSSDRGIQQHSVFTWDVEGDDFAYVDGLTDGARFTDAVITHWLAGFSDEEAAVVVDALFQALEASGAQNATEVLSGGTKSIALLSEAAKNIDPHGARRTAGRSGIACGSRRARGSPGSHAALRAEAEERRLSKLRRSIGQFASDSTESLPISDERPCWLALAIPNAANSSSRNARCDLVNCGSS